MDIKLKFPQAVLLDIDNTVYPYHPCHSAGLQAAQQFAATLKDCWHDALKFEEDYLQSRKVVKAQVGPQAAGHCRLLYFKTLIDRQFGRTDIKATMMLHEAYWQGYFSQMVPDPGCLEFLEELRSIGLGLAWVTNFTTTRQILKLKALGLEQSADFLITSEEAGVEKPSPALLYLALTRLQCSPQNAWMIGDDLKEDMMAARQIGLTAIWFRRHAGNDRDNIADDNVNNWFEMKDLFHRVKNCRHC